MRYTTLEHYASQPRLNRFLEASNHSKSKAQKLYRINLRVSQSFYPILNLFEIFLRNTIHYTLSSYFENEDWIIREKEGFMCHPSLKTSNFFLQKSIIKAEKNIRKKNRIVTADKIIAEQSFGFWTSLFDSHHYKLIDGIVIHCFPNKPSHVNRKMLSMKLNAIRDFRNRIYHNEPICFHQNAFDFSKAIKIQEEITDLLNWIDPELRKYIHHFKNINYTLNQATTL